MLLVMSIHLRCWASRAALPAAASFAFVAALLVAGPARADWSLPRADAQRTGAVAGTSDLVSPVPYWRAYLGGAIQARGALVMDVDSDTTGEVVYVSGGKLVAKERSDAMVWETPVLGISQIVGLADLDGDGVDELVVHGSKQVFVVDPATGRILWAEPATDFGFLGGARVADLDGDGAADLFVQECGCCRINNGNTGFVYRFSRGYDRALKSYTLPSVLCGGYKAMVVADMNGDGRREITLGENQRILLLDGATGAELAATAVLGERAGESLCVPVDVDRDGDDELLCVQSNSPLSTPEIGHRLRLLDYRASGPGASLAVSWERDIGELNRSITTGPGMVSDLDGDGSLELIVSGVLADGRVVTPILDAVTGALLAELGDERIAGVTMLAAGEPALILTTRETALTGWSFARARDRAQRIQQSWSLPGQRAISEPDWPMAARAFLASQLVVMDITGDGRAELLTTGQDPGRGITAYDLSSGAPVPVAEYPVAEGASVLTAWISPPMPQEPPRVLVAASTGIMQLLGGDLGALATGVRFGGYYPKGDWRNLHLTPVLGDLGTGADSVIIADSRGALLRLDAARASLAVPPRVAWEVAASSAPIIVPGLVDGGPGIACRQDSSTGDGDHRVAVLGPDGAVRWSAEVGGALLSDIVPAALDGDSAPDLVIEWGRRSDDELQHRAYSGASGQPLWDATAQLRGTTRFPAGGAITDWNRDGIDDFVHQYYDTYVLSGVDGSILSRSDTGTLVYFMPTVMNLDDDAEAEILLHGGFHPVRALDHGVGPLLGPPLWVSTDDDRPYPYGAVARRCADGSPRLVESSLRYPSTLKLTALSGAQAGSFVSLVLAGGRRWGSEDSAREAGVFLGQLTATSIHEGLSGDDRPIAVVGSEDGWLYAVDGCTGAPAFTVPLGASVGAVAFGDTDGNGKDEIIVAAGDGYLYALEQAPVRAPAWVIDVDPRRGIVDEDVDQIATATTMSAVWEAVAEADSYEVAVVHAATGAVMSTPAWQNVGAATSATLDGLALMPGQHYLFVARAVKNAEPSPDALSDGVMVDMADYPSGCGCSSGSPSPSGLLLLLAWLGLRGRVARLLRR